LSALGGTGKAHCGALPLAGRGTSKDAGCIAIGGKRHRAVVRYVGAAVEFRAGSAGGSRAAVCELDNDHAERPGPRSRPGLLTCGFSGVSEGIRTPDTQDHK